MKKILKNLVVMGEKLIFIGMIFFISLQSFATNSSLVWEKPTNIIHESISGPMAKAISIVVIVVSAFGWAFTEGGSFLGKGIKVVCALAIVAGAGVLLNGLYGNYASSILFG